LEFKNSIDKNHMNNKDRSVVLGFGEEWKKFDQSLESVQEDLRIEFEQYFSIFPWSILPPNAIGIDIGCGSGRWAKYVAPKVGTLHCCDPAEKALEVAKNNLKDFSNCKFHLASVDEISIEKGTLDFGYSLGVLHHIPDAKSGLRDAVNLLKPGAPFLLYLYYSFDNRPNWFKSLHIISDFGRKIISRLSFKPRFIISQIIAILVYLPLARASYIFEKFGFKVDRFPLSAYRNRSFYLMRTDALDRFGTQIEHRFSRKQIQEMMSEAGLVDIKFRNGTPYWCATGIKATV
jgi:ubiquinone/menaquinone biosynthesis C-methylase UbiE